MTLSTVAAGDPVKASEMNSIIAHVNGSPGRAIFTASGTWSVPAGAHKFKVYLAGGGGGGGGGIYHAEDFSSGEYHTTGGVGGDAPLISKVFAGVDIGTTYVITIGAGGAAALEAATGSTGGDSTFGTVMESHGGLGGHAGGGAGAYGGQTGGQIRHGNGMFVTSANKGYGAGGLGGSQTVGSDTTSDAGSNGICVIEW